MSTRWYEDEFLVDDYAALSRGDSAGNSWLYRINVDVPALQNRRLLAWTGYRSYEVQRWQAIGAGPSIFWSVPDPSGYRHWIRDDSQSPGVAELTLHLPNVDTWIARLPDGRITRLVPSEVAQRIAYAVIDNNTSVNQSLDVMSQRMAPASSSTGTPQPHPAPGPGRSGRQGNGRSSCDGCGAVLVRMADAGIDDLADWLEDSCRRVAPAALVRSL